MKGYKNAVKSYLEQFKTNGDEVTTKCKELQLVDPETAGKVSGLIYSMLLLH